MSVLSERRVFTARAYLSTASASSGQAVPFYLMPTLGGNETLRGYQAYRFRGPHALLLQGEYRFEVWSGLDAALFYDAGKVALRRRDLGFRDLETNYGFGFRFNTDHGTILRIGHGARRPRRRSFLDGVRWHVLTHSPRSRWPRPSPRAARSPASPRRSTTPTTRCGPTTTRRSMRPR